MIKEKYIYKEREREKERASEHTTDFCCGFVEMSLTQTFENSYKCITTNY